MKNVIKIRWRKKNAQTKLSKINKFKKILDIKNYKILYNSVRLSYLTNWIKKIWKNKQLYKNQVMQKTAGIIIIILIKK